MNQEGLRRDYLADAQRWYETAESIEPEILETTAVNLRAKLKAIGPGQEIQVENIQATISFIEEKLKEKILALIDRTKKQLGTGEGLSLDECNELQDKLAILENRLESVSEVGAVNKTPGNVGNMPTDVFTFDPSPLSPIDAVPVQLTAEDRAHELSKLRSAGIFVSPGSLKSRQ